MTQDSRREEKERTKEQDELRSCGAETAWNLPVTCEKLIGHENFHAAFDLSLAWVDEPRSWSMPVIPSWVSALRDKDDRVWRAEDDPQWGRMWRFRSLVFADRALLASIYGPTFTDATPVTTEGEA